MEKRMRPDAAPVPRGRFRVLAYTCGNGAKIAAGINPTESYHHSYTSLIF